MLREPSFLPLFVARTISLLGDAIAPVALAFAMLSLPNGSATSLGIVLTARIVAQLTFVLFGGVIADRMPKQWVMVIADLTAGATQAIIATLFITHHAVIPVVAALSTLNGAAAALFRPAARALVPGLVAKEYLQSANALLRFSMNTGSILGAALSGVLVALLGPGWALAVDALSFLASAGLIAGVRTRDLITAPAGRLLAQLRDGWREFTARQWVWMMVTQLAFANVCIAGGIVVLGPVVAKAYLGGAVGWAVAVAAQAAGLVVGSLVGMRLRSRYPVRFAALLTVGFVPPLVALALDAPLPVVVAGMFVTGFCIDVYEILFQTAVQVHVPPHALARVMSYDSLGSFALIPVGLAIVGPLSALIGVATTLLGAAVLVTASGAIVLLSASVRNVRGASSYVAASTT